MSEDRSTAPDDITAALPGLLPDLERDKWLGWALIVATAVASVALAIVLIPKGENAATFGLVGLALCAAAIILIAKQVRRWHEARLIPIVARAAGLSYTQNSKPFIQSLPPRLLPKGVRKSQDLVEGKFNGRRISFVEARVETGGKNSRTLFSGVVAAFPNANPMPAFFVASEKQTRKSFWYGQAIKVDGLLHIRDVAGLGGHGYGIWCSSLKATKSPGFDEVIAAIIGLDRKIGPEAQLFTATCDGTNTHVALSFTRDLFRAGGLFAGKDRLIEDLSRAYADLTLPLRTASILLEAENSVLAASVEQTPEA